MDKKINIGVVLSAYDKLSAVVTASVNKSITSLEKLKHFSSNAASFGMKSIAAGAAAGAPILAAAQAYADQEKSFIGMKTALMQDGNRINQQQLAQLDNYTKKSIALYGYSKQANMDMVTTFLNNGATTKQILGGMGDAVQQLGVAFNIPAADAAQFASRMARDMNITASQMPAFMDQINRLRMIGVGGTGPNAGAETVTEMQEAFSKVGLAASVMGPKAQGLQAAKDLGASMAIFIKRGFSGSVVGTDFYKILMGAAQPDKMKKVNEALFATNGQQLNFFDAKGQFAGYPQMIGELNKLQGLTISQISAVLKPFANKAGPIAGILASLSEKGTQGFNENQFAMAHKASLIDINKQIMAELSMQEQISKNLALAAASDIGKTYSKEIIGLLHSVNSLLGAIDAFTQKHQTLTKILAGSLGIFSILATTGGGLALAFSGIAKFGAGAAWVGKSLLWVLVRGIPLMASFTATIWAQAAAWAANPVTWIVLGIIAALAALVAIGVVVYKNWDKIMRWFSNQWKSLKAQVAGIIAVFGLFLDVIIGVNKAVLGLFTMNPSLLIDGIKQTASAVSKIASGGISAAYNTAHDQSLRESNQRPVKPIMQTVHNHNHTYTQTVNVNGTGIDHKELAEHLKGKFDKFLKDREAKKARLGYE